jgi:gliding motility-associated-like protein
MKKITLILIFSLLSFVGFSQGLPLEGFENTSSGPDLPTNPSEWTLDTGTLGNQWMVFDNGVGTGQRWDIYNSPAANVYAGVNSASINRENVGQGNTSEDYLATPLITVPTNGRLRFWTRTGTNGPQGNCFYQIKIAPATAVQNNPAEYTLLQQWNETSLTTTFNIYEEKIVDLSAYANQSVYIAFVMVLTQPSTGITGDRWIIDNAQVVQQCNAPTSPTTGTITYNSANFNWQSPGVTTWEIEVVIAGNAPTGVGTLYSGPLPYTATGLLPNTTYQYYVRNVCGTNNTSAWTTSAQFTTLLAPVQCNGNFADSGGVAANYANTANSTVVICPTGGLPGDAVTVTFTSFDIAAGDGMYIYNGNSAAAPLISSGAAAAAAPLTTAGFFSGTAFPGPFTSSSPDGCLTYVFRSNSSTTATGWVANITCAPLPTCPKPFTVSTSLVTSTSVSVAWQEAGTAAAWEVLALPCGSPAPTATATGFTATTTNPKVITGLNPDTCYDIYVRSVCGASSSSWTGPKPVTTLVAPPVCGAVYTDLGGIAGNYPNSVTATTPGGTVTITPTVAGEQVIVTFTAFNTQATSDVLRVYNGSSTAATLIGTYSGDLSATLPVVESTTGNGLTFQFISNATTQSTGWAANVVCQPFPSCQKPTNVTVANITYSTVSVSWTNNATSATQWEVIAVPAGSPAPGAGAVGQIATASPYIYTGLSPVTSYDVYVRAICPGNDVGPWSNIKATLTTPESCPKPTNVVATVQTFSTVSVAWTNNAPGATQWEVIAVPTGSPAPTATSLGQLAAASPYLYTGLNSQTTYDFYVRTICQPASGTDIGLWSITASTTSTLPNYCAGDHFYDLGGATGNYPNNANSTVTICPDSPGQVVTVYFNSFNLVSSLNDTLTIYDGNNTTTGAVIGTYYGTNIIPNYTASGPSGCLTFRFVSNGTLNAAGWDATIICGPPCPSIVANINASTPAAAADNTIKICQGGSIEFVGSGTFGGSGTGATYEWDFGDGSTPVPTATATHTYANEGIYLANLKIVAADGCRSNNKINQLVYVSTTPNFNGITIADDEICLGQSTTILGSVVPKPFFKDCAPPVSGTTFLPDGAGNSYQSQVPVDCFPFGTNLTSASQIASVCINMEHSYLGDLELRLISPTGQSIILHQYPGGGGTYLGCPLDDPAVGPGTGRTYCFTPSATTLLVNGTTSAACANTTPGNSIVAGNYAPVQSFAGLIGSPLNGNWSLLVTDNLNIDNGYIFDWTIDFANSILPTNYQFTPVVANTSWTANPSIVSTNGQTITVTPTTVGQNCYTYNMTDDFGCTYSKQVCLNVTAGVALTDVTSVSPICNGGNSSFTLTGSPDTTVSYSIDGGASQSVALGSTGQAVINLTGLTASTTINTTYITAPVVPTSGNAITAVGGVTPVNATGPISAVGATASAANCTTINNGNSTLTLTFDDEILAGTNVTISIARSNTAGSVNISDGSTAPPTVFNNVVYPGPNAVIQHITFTPTVNTNTIIITRNNGNTFVDGAQYSFNAPGCDAPAIKTSTITVTPVLTDPVITNVSEICAGNDAVFNLTGLPNAILSYTIDGGAAQTITLNNLGTAAITVTAPTTTVSIVFSNLTLNGCTRVITNTASIAVKPVPTLTSFVSNSPLCAGDNAVFTITGTPNSTVNYTIGSGSNQQLALGATGQNTITVNAVTANTTVSLSGIDLNGCALPSTQSLTVLVAPVLYDPTITNVSEMCIGGDAVFNVTGLPNGLISYSINGGASQLLTLSATGTGVITSIAPTSTVNLTMTSISINTCARLLTNTASIIVKPVPSVTSLTTPETIICSGLDAILTVTGTANSNVTYSIGTGASQQLVLGASGQNTISLNDLTANTTVTLSNVSLNGCSQPTTQSLTVTVVALTSATFTLVPEYCLGETVDPLPTTSQNGVAGVWAPALVNTTISGPANYVFTPMATMCAETTTVSLTVNGCDIQKGISPKGIGAGDGLNDNFDLSGFNVSKLEIFNRHGLTVYDKSNYEDEWFGQSNSGQELPDGTYYYVISFSDSETKTGWIYINREK